MDSDNGGTRLGGAILDSLLRTKNHGASLVLVFFCFFDFGFGLGVDGLGRFWFFGFSVFWFLGDGEGWEGGEGVGGGSRQRDRVLQDQVRVVVTHGNLVREQDCG